MSELFRDDQNWRPEYSWNHLRFAYILGFMIGGALGWYFTYQAIVP